ncbi:MAG: antitoxin [Gaiella sp.]
MYDRRLQILIDDERLGRVRRRAETTNRSVADVIREAIDVALPVDGDRRRVAAARVLAAEPSPVGEPGELRAELEAIRAGEL